MQAEQIFLQGGALVAICIIAFTFARHLTAFNKELFERTDDLIKNHLMHSTEALRQLENAIEELVGYVKEIVCSNEDSPKKKGV